jgi:hypothetical protein
MNWLESLLPVDWNVDNGDGSAETAIVTVIVVVAMLVLTRRRMKASRAKRT